MKVAYLALTYKTFQKHDALMRFFSQDACDQYNLYIHNKEDMDPDDPFKQYVIPDRVPTQWGHYSLVEATVKLLQHALQDDPQNERFILISDSHLPLYNIETTCRILREQCNVASFRFFNEHQARHRFFRIFNKETKPFHIPIKLQCASNVSQWFACTRADAIAYVRAASEYDSCFDKNAETYADECWFAVMTKHYGLPYQDRSFVFSDWWWNTPQSMVDKGCKLNPHTFAEVTREFVDVQRQNGHLFLRKVHPDTIIDTDYLFV